MGTQRGLENVCIRIIAHRFIYFASFLGQVSWTNF